MRCNDCTTVDFVYLLHGTARYNQVNGVSNRQIKVCLYRAERVLSIFPDFFWILYGVVVSTLSFSKCLDIPCTILVLFCHDRPQWSAVMSMLTTQGRVPVPPEHKAVLQRMTIGFI